MGAAEVAALLNHLVRILTFFAKKRMSHFVV